MDVSSFGFIFFLVVFLLLYYLVEGGHQWIVLIMASFTFYIFSARAYTFVYIMVTTITIYLSSLYFEKEQCLEKKKILLVVTLLVNIGILVLLKYTNLFINTFNMIWGNIHYINSVDWIAPLAVSFYTLQMTAYLVDVYWKKTKAEKNPLKVLLYCIYFPQMVSGPISRYEDVSPSLFSSHKFDYDTVTNGFIRIAWGLIKKLTISNRIALLVDYLQKNPAIFNGQWIWITAFIYIFQIYTDFSGCMDIVLGASQCFGIELSENFNAPFFSKTIQEFWRRWHITLGVWLKDYIMVPVERSRFMYNLRKASVARFGKKTGRRIPSYLSMLVLWIVMGLWHGSSWKYIVGEGMWFWFIITMGQILEPISKKLRMVFHVNGNEIWFRMFQIIRTLLIFTIGMLFFRASSLSDAIYRIKAGIGLNFNTESVRSVIIFTYEKIGVVGGAALVISFLALIIVDRNKYKKVDILKKLRELPVVYRWLVYFAMTAIISLSVSGNHQAFAYAQF